MDHTACYHDNKLKFPFTHLTKCFSTLKQSSLPKLPPASLPPREFEEYISIDLLQTSRARTITWLIQMSVRSPPRFFSLLKRYQFEIELLWLNGDDWAAQSATGWIELLFPNVSERRCAQLWPSCATTSVHHASRLREQWQGSAPSGPQWKDERVGKGHTKYPVWSRSPRAEKTLFFGLHTEIDSPPLYLGEGAARIHLHTVGGPDTEMPDQIWACFGHFDPWPSVHPFSHLEVSEIDVDQSKALFWVPCSSDHHRFDILTAGTVLSVLLKILNLKKFRAYTVKNLYIQAALMLMWR